MNMAGVQLFLLPIDPHNRAAAHNRGYPTDQIALFSLSAVAPALLRASALLRPEGTPDQPTNEEKHQKKEVCFETFHSQRSHLCPLHPTDQVSPTKAKIAAENHKKRSSFTKRLTRFSTQPKILYPAQPRLLNRQTTHTRSTTTTTIRFLHPTNKQTERFSCPPSSVPHSHPKQCTVGTNEDFPVYMFVHTAHVVYERMLRASGASSLVTHVCTTTTTR